MKITSVEEGPSEEEWLYVKKKKKKRLSTPFSHGVSPEENVVSLQLKFLVTWSSVPRGRTAESYNKFPEFAMPFLVSEENECKHVYVDLGAKSGENLRTLFFGAAPQQASLLSTKFDESFGSNFTARRKTVCVIATEPDPTYRSILTDLEKELVSMGAKIKVILNPVWVSNDFLTLQFAPNNNQHIDHLTDETKNKHNLTMTPRITSDCQRHF